MSVSDVFSTVYAGGELNIIPKALFSFPMKLIEFLNERKINTIYWVPSALCIIANWRALDYGELKYVKKVLFAGEVMPVKQLFFLHYFLQLQPLCQGRSQGRAVHIRGKKKAVNESESCDPESLPVDGDLITGPKFTTAAVFVFAIDEYLIGGEVGLRLAAFVDDVCKFQKLPKRNVLGFDFDFVDIVHTFLVFYL